MPEVKIEALKNPFEKLIKYFEHCELGMYQYPTDLYGKESAYNHRESYYRMACGAMEFILSCYPELKKQDDVADYLEEWLCKLDCITDEKLTCEDIKKRKMELKNWNDILKEMVNT